MLVLSRYYFVRVSELFLLFLLIFMQCHSFESSALLASGQTLLIANTLLWDKHKYGTPPYRILTWNSIGSTWQHLPKKPSLLLPWLGLSCCGDHLSLLRYSDHPKAAASHLSFMRGTGYIFCVCGRGENHSLVAEHCILIFPTSVCTIIYRI